MLLISIDLFPAAVSSELEFASHFEGNVQQFAAGGVDAVRYQS
ncbi:hypothetical protein [Serratia sp. M24T3]|nr:hypothetical protein [Serratia sp. M24T3]